MKKYIKIVILIIVIIILCLFFLFKKEAKKTNKINEVSNAIEMTKGKPAHASSKLKNNSMQVIKLPKEIQSLEKTKIVNDMPSKPTKLEYKPPVVNKVKKSKANQEIQIYNTPYFSIKYSADEWDYAEGKDMDIPSYIKIPRHVPVAMVEFINKKDNNLIFIYVSNSSRVNFNKMSQQRITDYIQYLYNDTRSIDLTFKTINGLKFASYQFSPTNNSSILTKQFLATKNEKLFNIAFVETHANPIDLDFIKHHIIFK
ncbi:MAG TPA: hypothetical protein QF753_06300 [Victivallales bacterium]|nr:hypothetical protein [Victivallales bacterium]